MRERKGSGFGRRSVASESKQAIKKYFLLYEGSDTEVLYFDAIEDMRKEIELNSLIELVPIIRCFSEEGWSNPRKILDRVIQYIPEIIKFEDLTYEENYDEICLIVDRDKESFIESQYEYVKQKCEE